MLGPSVGAVCASAGEASARVSSNTLNVDIRNSSTSSAASRTGAVSTARTRLSRGGARRQRPALPKWPPRITQWQLKGRPSCQAWPQTQTATPPGGPESRCGWGSDRPTRRSERGPLRSARRLRSGQERSGGTRMHLLMMDMMVDMRGTSLAHQSARCARVFKASVYCLYHGGLLAPQDGAAQARQLVVAL